MTEQVERLAADSDGQREVVLIGLQGWSWPAGAGVDWYTAFIAADARDVSVERVSALANAMLSHRCAYVSVWGPGCERVHDIFDEVFVERSYLQQGHDSISEWSQDIPFLMTTWHEHESLASALRFALYTAIPSDDGYYEERPPTFVALAEPQYRDSVRGLILDRERLDRESDGDLEA